MRRIHLVQPCATPRTLAQPYMMLHCPPCAFLPRYTFWATASVRFSRRKLHRSDADSAAACTPASASARCAACSSSSVAAKVVVNIS
eukprot:CAMPEP_0177680268 /NCGR_PEP_ID=MMETSP0447-20121125/30078_2 /TAXON_ID=0 /ORGANISM="Stygamoeba regulata, Strain BSH-02190019" /LENGTH=86 /DNA_ID=CAMNT_0019189579 /DNA_START=164 /DNA_END=424 /DNA_ORIENTATION=-